MHLPRLLIFLLQILIASMASKDKSDIPKGPATDGDISNDFDDGAGSFSRLWTRSLLLCAASLPVTLAIALAPVYPAVHYLTFDPQCRAGDKYAFNVGLGWVIASALIAVAAHAAVTLASACYAFQYARSVISKSAVAVAATWVCLLLLWPHAQFYFIHPKMRSGNFLSAYASNIAYATETGRRVVLFTAPFSFHDEFLVRNLPNPAFITDTMRASIPVRLKHHTCYYAHELAESYSWDAIPAMQPLLQDILQLTPKSQQQTCAVHFRLDDIIVVNSPQYPLTQYSWYRDMLRRSSPACKSISLFSHISKTPTAFANQGGLSSADEFGHELVQQFALSLRRDFPLAQVTLTLNGTLDADMRTMASADHFVGSCSTLSLWIAIAARGSAFLPQTPLYSSGEARELRPDLAFIVKAPNIPANWTFHKLASYNRSAILHAMAFEKA